MIAEVGTPLEATRRTGELRSLEQRYILGMRVDATTYPDATERVVRWARAGESRYLCVATVHTTMEARHSSAFRHIVNEADLVTPDGMPLVWGLRLLGIKHATRVYGPDLTPCLLERAAAEGIPVGLYGGAPHALERFAGVLAQRIPGLRVPFLKSPPFRPPTSEEDAADVNQINQSGIRILLVGLGCPKQERWLAEHVGRVRAVMVGVGAAFDFLAGTKSQAPRWMQASGLEWLFRLCTEPRRLWHRYLILGPQFVGLFGLQLLGVRRFEGHREQLTIRGHGRR